MTKNRRVTAKLGMGQTLDADEPYKVGRRANSYKWSFFPPTSPVFFFTSVTCLCAAIL